MRLQFDYSNVHNGGIAKSSKRRSVEQEGNASSECEEITNQFMDTDDTVDTIARVHVVSLGADIWNLQSQAAPSPRMVMDYISNFVGLGRLGITATVRQCGATSLRKYPAKIQM